MLRESFREAPALAYILQGGQVRVRTLSGRDPPQDARRPCITGVGQEIWNLSPIKRHDEARWIHAYGTLGERRARARPRMLASQDSWSHAAPARRASRHAERQQALAILPYGVKVTSIPLVKLNPPPHGPLGSRYHAWKRSVAPALHAPCWARPGPHAAPPFGATNVTP